MSHKVLKAAINSVKATCTGIWFSANHGGSVFNLDLQTCNPKIQNSKKDYLWNDVWIASWIKQIILERAYSSAFLAWKFVTTLLVFKQTLF